MDKLHSTANAMRYFEAIEKRISRRTYLNENIEPDKLKKINEYICNYNKLSGLSIQFIEDASKGFNGLIKSYGMFHGVKSIIALVGKTSDPYLKEKAGYFGELLVLEAALLGLGTCFVGDSYDKKNCPCKIEEDESLVCVITIGPVDDKPSLKEKLVYRMTHRNTVKAENLYESEGEVPSWFLNGIKAVQLAPSALNRHPVKFVYKSGNTYAFVEETNKFDLVDLGIAKLHFEIGAGGKFAPGNYGTYSK